MQPLASPWNRVTAGRGVGKVEPGSEKILGVGLDFKIGICPAHPRSDVGLEKLRALCEAYVEESSLVLLQSRFMIYVMFRSSCAYARLQYFAQAVCLLATEYFS